MLNYEQHIYAYISQTIGILYFSFFKLVGNFYIINDSMMISC